MEEVSEDMDAFQCEFCSFICLAYDECVSHEEACQFRPNENLPLDNEMTVPTMSIPRAEVEVNSVEEKNMEENQKLNAIQVEETSTPDATVFSCEYYCGFTGDFEQVSSHESSCKFNPSKKKVEDQEIRSSAASAAQERTILQKETLEKVGKRGWQDGEVDTSTQDTVEAEPAARVRSIPHAEVEGNSVEEKNMEENQKLNAIMQVEETSATDVTVFSCEYDCGFTGGFEQVSAHESSCKFNTSKKKVEDQEIRSLSASAKQERTILQKETLEKRGRQEGKVDISIQVSLEPQCSDPRVRRDGEASAVLAASYATTILAASDATAVIAASERRDEEALSKTKKLVLAAKDSSSQKSMDQEEVAAVLMRKWKDERGTSYFLPAASKEREPDASSSTRRENALKAKEEEAAWQSFEEEALAKQKAADEALAKQEAEDKASATLAQRKAVEDQQAFEKSEEKKGEDEALAATRMMMAQEVSRGAKQTAAEEEAATRKANDEAVERIGEETFSGDKIGGIAAEKAPEVHVGLRLTAAALACDQAAEDKTSATLAHRKAVEEEQASEKKEEKKGDDEALAATRMTMAEEASRAAKQTVEEEEAATRKATDEAVERIGEETFSGDKSAAIAAEKAPEVHVGLGLTAAALACDQAAEDKTSATLAQRKAVEEQAFEKKGKKKGEDEAYAATRMTTEEEALRAAKQAAEEEAATRKATDEAVERIGWEEIAGDKSAAIAAEKAPEVHVGLGLTAAALACDQAAEDKTSATLGEDEALAATRMTIAEEVSRAAKQIAEEEAATRKATDEAVESIGWEEIAGDKSAAIAAEKAPEVHVGLGLTAAALACDQAVPFTLTLDMDLKSIADKEVFKRQVSTDVATAAKIEPRHVRVTALRAGSVLVDMLIAQEAGDPQEILRDLEGQIKTVNSLLMQGKVTSKSCNVALGAGMNTSHPGIQQEATETNRKATLTSSETYENATCSSDLISDMIETQTLALSSSALSSSGLSGARGAVKGNDTESTDTLLPLARDWESKSELEDVDATSEDALRMMPQLPQPLACQVQTILAEENFLAAFESSFVESSISSTSFVVDCQPAPESYSHQLNHCATPFEDTQRNEEDDDDDDDDEEEEEEEEELLKSVKSLVEEGHRLSKVLEKAEGCKQGLDKAMGDVGDVQTTQQRLVASTAQKRFDSENKKNSEEEEEKKRKAAEETEERRSTEEERRLAAEKEEKQKEEEEENKCKEECEEKKRQEPGPPSPECEAPECREEPEEETRKGEEESKAAIDSVGIRQLGGDLSTHVPLVSGPFAERCAQYSVGIGVTYFDLLSSHVVTHLETMMLCDQNAVPHGQAGYLNDAVEVGDKLLRIDNTPIAPFNANTVNAMLCGPYSSTVVITLENFDAESVPYTITALRHIPVDNGNAEQASASTTARQQASVSTTARPCLDGIHLPSNTRARLNSDYQGVDSVDSEGQGERGRVLGGIKPDVATQQGTRELQLKLEARRQWEEEEEEKERETEGGHHFVSRVKKALERGIRRRVCVAWCSTALKQAQQRNKLSSGAEAISRQCGLAHVLHAFVRNRLLNASEKICKSLSAAEVKSCFDSSGGAATKLQQSYNDENLSSFSQAPEMQVESSGGQHCGKAPVGQHCDAAADRAGDLVCMRVCSA